MNPCFSPRSQADIIASSAAGSAVEAMWKAECEYHTIREKSFYCIKCKKWMQMYSTCKHKARRGRNSYEHDTKYMWFQVDSAITIQALVRGVIARGRVIPALLSPDPTDLRQAVLFCANGCK
jgi:hypothetical protein